MYGVGGSACSDKCGCGVGIVSLVAVNCGGDRLWLGWVAGMSGCDGCMDGGGGLLLCW